MPETQNKDNNNIKCKELIYKKNRYVFFLYFKKKINVIRHGLLGYVSTTKNEATSI